MTRCIQCGSELTKSEGPRKKQFCNSACRSRHWQNGKKELQKLMSEPELTKEKIIAFKEKIVAAKPIVANLTPEQSKEVKDEAANSSKWIRREVPDMPKGMTTFQQILWKKEHGVK